MKVAIFGDTGGHYVALRKALDELTEVDRVTLKPDIHVVHLGDLVHRGPNSNEVVELVDELMEANPDRWTQIVGNHEAMHLGMGVGRFFRCNCSDATIEILRSWWRDDKLIPAAAIVDVESRTWATGNRPKNQESMVTDLLCVHGGLTREFWSQELESPDTAFETALALWATSDKKLAKEGLMTGDAYGTPGPIWATAAEEVLLSWKSEPMPFSQVVGHTTPYSQDRQTWRPSITREMRRCGKGVPEERRAVLFGNGGLILCQDPGYGVKPVLDTQPYLLLEALYVI